MENLCFVTITYRLYGIIDCSVCPAKHSLWYHGYNRLNHHHIQMPHMTTWASGNIGHPYRNTNAMIHVIIAIQPCMFIIVYNLILIFCEQPWSINITVIHSHLRTIMIKLWTIANVCPWLWSIMNIHGQL